ncbi:MAG: hypothetical protein JRN42_05025 [Nitrososphaerota archaeon]|nr:hypothetical protein [Nitrososphaerota archaeon]
MSDNILSKYDSRASMNFPAPHSMFAVERKDSIHSNSYSDFGPSAVMKDSFL